MVEFLVDQENTVTCNQCCWVHVQVSESYIKSWEKRWKLDWKKMSIKSRQLYGVVKGPPKRTHYLRCFGCGGSYKNFRDSLPQDMKPGTTMQCIKSRNSK